MTKGIDVEGSVMDANDEHPAKTPSPRVMILFGSIIDTNDEHSLKTPSPIEVIV
eukprot:CAMPEP_0198253890 /NCGR_PEP_ID=MMETSP1447-20131203/4269_1 /TAXON_ID=420782 /ORGANISM="Chaetoceros dichaeta, Strain CCMP1751" /LENGTH=53 /DNA_ID=CAMNT_0043939735 /DNA_START=45 /DNA_END=207 /DNA_ORIENTATION=+